MLARIGLSGSLKTRLPYYGFSLLWVNEHHTLSLDDDLVKEVRKIAVERDTTLTGLVRTYLQDIAAEHAKSGRKRRELEALNGASRNSKSTLGSAPGNGRPV